MPSKKAYSPDECYARLAAYCARGERSELDVRRKLRLWEIDEALAAAIIDRLLQEGFLDLERFARAFVRDKYHFNGWGPVRLRAELRKHQLPSTLIDRALSELEEELEEEDDEQLMRLLSTKLQSLPPSLDRRKRKERLLRFGLYRGYTYDEVRSTIQELLDDEDE